MKRQRGRGRKPGNQNSNRSFDSNGPSVKIRGSASQISEKYQALARDANLSGDRIAAENFLQHAEHYYRLVRAAQANAVQNSNTNVVSAKEVQSHETGEKNNQPSDTPAEASGLSEHSDRSETNEGSKPKVARKPLRARRRPAGESPRANGKGGDHGDDPDSAAPSSEPTSETPVSDEVPA